MYIQILLLALSSLIVISASFSRPAADDLCLAGETQQLGTSAYVQKMYQTWSGRWGQLALQSTLSPLEPMLSAILPIVLLIGLWAAWAWATQQSWWALLGVVAWASLVPKLDETLFWASASLTYALPLLLAGVWVGMVRRGWFWASAVLIVFLAAGFSEMLNLQLGYALALMALLVPRYRRVVLLSGIGLGIAFGVVILAPGNAVRAAYFPERQLIPALSTTWIALQGYVETLLPHIPLLLVVGWAGAHLAPKRHIRYRAGWALLVFALLVVWLYVGVFSSAYAQGGGLALRQFLPLHFGLVLACFAWGALMGKPAYRWLAGLVLLISCVYWGQVLTDSRTHAQAWDTRHVALQAGQTQVNAIGGYGDITPDPAHWVNQCAAQWYGLPFVQTSP